MLPIDIPNVLRGMRIKQILKWVDKFFAQGIRCLSFRFQL